jgi:DNA-binding GntR family transcriptional regulator
MVPGSDPGGSATVGPFSFEPVTAPTKGEATYAEISVRILDASIVPGAVLNQRTLAQALGISITPLRESLRRLEGEGLVEVRADKTVSVVALTARELSELRLVRLGLDPLAASLAATVSTEDERATLLAMAHFPPTSSPVDWHQAHRCFHSAIH